MTIVRTRRTIDNAGAGRGHRRRRAPRERERLPGGDRGRRPVRRADRDASHRGRPGRELAGGRGQGAHRCDLHPPEPRDGGAGDRRTARGPRLARRLVPHRRHPAEGRRRGRGRAVGTSGETPDEDESCSIAGSMADFSTAEFEDLTQEGARLAAERGVAPVVSAVDAGGALIYLHRPDDAQVASVEVTTDKARTAAIYRRPSKDFEGQASGGRPSSLHLARAVP